MNPITMVGKVVKSEKVINQMEDSLKQPATSWKTTVSGVLSGLLLLATLWAPPQYQAKLIATSGALVAMGLINAKDKDVTGGTRKQ